MICDFGLARIFLEEGHTDMTTTSEHTGTARYLAPELVSSDETVYPTTASDVYGLACLGLEVNILDFDTRVLYDLQIMQILIVYLPSKAVCSPCQQLARPNIRGFTEGVASCFSETTA